MTNLDRLLELMPPPEEPLELPAADDWARCEREIAALPSDYKMFLSKYGTGLIDGFLWVFNPVASNEYLNFLSEPREILEGMSTLSRQLPSMYSMPWFPDPGGFLPFAGTDNGDNIFWVTTGEPGAWTVAVMNSRAPDVYPFEGGLVDFLVALIADEFSCGAFPGDFPSSRKVKFTPQLG